MSVDVHREWGVLVERAVATILGVEHVPDEPDQYAYDVEVQDPVLVARDDDVHELEPGTVGEVKAIARTICRDSSPRPGRVNITRENHCELCNRDGFYAFAIYDPHDAHGGLDVQDVQDAIDELVLATARDVDDALPSWRPDGRGLEYTQLAWTSLLDSVATTGRRSWSYDAPL